METAEEIPAGLRSLAAELDALAASADGPPVGGLPDSSGTDFRVLNLIGRGGIGEVYAATQLSLDRPVAVKLLPSEAGRAALSLATTLAPTDRPNGDFRAREIERAVESVTALAERFPDNPEIKSALGKLRYAKEAHARFRERRGRR